MNTIIVIVFGVTIIACIFFILLLCHVTAILCREMKEYRKHVYDLSVIMIKLNERIENMEKHE